MKIDIVFIIVAIIIIGMTLWGAHRGLRGLVFGLIGWIFTLGFVSWMTPRAEEFLANSSYRQWVYEHVEEHIHATAEKQIEEKSQSVEDATGELDIPAISQLLLIVTDTTEQKVEEATDMVVTAVSEELTDRAVSATAMMGSLIIALIIRLLVSLVLGAVHELPVIGGISRLIGGIWGFAEGILAVWVLFILATCLSISQLGQTVLVSIANNPILFFLYQNNLILKLAEQIRSAIGA